MNALSDAWQRGVREAWDLGDQAGGPELEDYIGSADPFKDLKPLAFEVDQNLALQEVAFAYHDFTCENGPTCTDRAEAGEAYDAIMPGLLAVANVATQLALLHLTWRLNLSEKEQQAFGIVAGVDWAALLPLIGCASRRTLDNGDVIECTERGQHPFHQASYQDVVITWEDDDSPDSPEKAAQAMSAEETAAALKELMPGAGMENEQLRHATE